MCSWSWASCWRDSCSCCLWNSAMRICLWICCFCFRDSSSCCSCCSRIEALMPGPAWGPGACCWPGGDSEDTCCCCCWWWWWWSTRRSMGMAAGGRRRGSAELMSTAKRHRKNIRFKNAYKKFSIVSFVCCTRKKYSITHFIQQSDTTFSCKAAFTLWTTDVCLSISWASLQG